MAQININVARTAYSSAQTPVVYNQENAPKFPQLEVILAPSTDTTMPTYAAGRLVALYGSDAPSAGLVGTYVNWNPASAVDSQKIPVGIICDEWAKDLTGVDITSQTTATNTINTINIAPLLIGTTLYRSGVIAGNSSAIVTAFNNYFNINELQDIMIGQTKTQLICLQGVAS